MTCREFEQRSALLTLRDISQAQDQQILGHAGECPKCADWLQEQRMLAASMQALQAQTADCDAGPDVEQAVLRAFRQGPAETVPPEMARRVSPIAFSLSRFFEVGAYVAVAAAVAVAIFLGVRLWEQHSVNLPTKSQVAQPTVSVPVAVAKVPASNAPEQLAAAPRSTNHRSGRSHVVAASQPTSDAADSSQVSAEADYVALMFCDPLSCSSDAQVVRMEIPSPGAAGSGTQQDAQVRVADVIVGYDGVVRAVRIVN